MAKLQIVDLAAGAQLTDVTYDMLADPDPAYNVFRRRYLTEYASSLGVGAYRPPPAANPGHFSVTNGAFFTSTSTDYTELSMPYKGGQRYSYGVAIHGGDPAAPIPKRVLRFNRPSSSGLQIASFPTTYSEDDAACPGWQVCMVGFDPLTDPAGDPNANERRTFVGTDAALGATATRAYVVTTTHMTVAEANAVLQTAGANATMQFDGGGSTGMMSYAGHMPQSPLARAVPHALVVSYAR